MGEGTTGRPAAQERVGVSTKRAAKHYHSRALHRRYAFSSLRQIRHHALVNGSIDVTPDETSRSGRDTSTAHAASNNCASGVDGHRQPLQRPHLSPRHVGRQRHHR